MRLQTYMLCGLLACLMVIPSYASVQGVSYVSHRTSEARTNSMQYVGYSYPQTYSYSAPITNTVAGTSFVAKAHVAPVTTKVHVYKPFSNDLPSSYSPVMRRASENEDDWDLETDPTVTPGNPGTQAPLGSSAVLVLFALAYVAYIAYQYKSSKSRVL